MKINKSLFLAAALFLLIPLLNVTFGQDDLNKVPFPVGGMKAIAENVQYPAEAKEEGIQGIVLVKAVISEKGEVISAEVVKTVDKRLDKAALKAVKAAKFEAGLKDGKPIEAEVTIPIKFKLG